MQLRTDFKICTYKSLLASIVHVMCMRFIEPGEEQSTYMLPGSMYYNASQANVPCMFYCIIFNYIGGPFDVMFYLWRSGNQGKPPMNLDRAGEEKLTDYN